MGCVIRVYPVLNEYPMNTEIFNFIPREDSPIIRNHNEHFLRQIMKRNNLEIGLWGLFSGHLSSPAAEISCFNVLLALLLCLLVLRDVV